MELCNKVLSEENNKIENIKLEYSYTQKILFIFTDNFLYVIDNSKSNPNLISKLKINLSIKHTSLHPKNQNQLLMTTKEENIYLIQDIKAFSKLDQMIKLNINIRNILSIKFSYFDNYFGILHGKNKFNLFYIKQNKEEILLSEELENNYIDFHFCPQFSLGFDLFMIIFMAKNGDLSMYGPYFPPEFFIKKEYFFNMDNFLLDKLNTVEKSESDYQKYAISLAIINDLKNSLIKETKGDYLIKISDKIRKINATFKKREIFINNNFLSNSSMDLLDMNYKQIFLLEKRPLTILRISENDNIDLIVLSEEIFPELASVGNIVSNDDIKINNYFVEYIQLNKNKIGNDYLIKMVQYNNDQLYIKTSDSLFLVQIPYLNELKKAVDDNIMFIPNKIKKTSINKLFKWNTNNNVMNKSKTIDIKDILIIPELRKLLIFGILKEKIKVKEHEKEVKKIINKVVIKESNYMTNDNFLNNAKFKDIFQPDKRVDIGDDIEDIKLAEIYSIKNDLQDIKINVDEKLLEDKSINFEEKLNYDMNNLFKIYSNLIQKNDELFLNKIQIMKDIYKNLSNSKIKESIDDTNKRINVLKTLKERIIQNNETISKKIESINDKINKYELTDDEIKDYLNILKVYQREMGDKLRDIEKRIKFCEECLSKNFLFKDLFPNNDLDFNLIEKDNQKKYLNFEEEINSKSKELYIKVQK